MVEALALPIDWIYLHGNPAACRIGNGLVRAHVDGDRYFKAVLMPDVINMEGHIQLIFHISVTTHSEMVRQSIRGGNIGIPPSNQPPSDLTKMMQSRSTGPTVPATIVARTTALRTTRSTRNTVTRQTRRERVVPLVARTLEESSCDRDGHSVDEDYHNGISPALN